MSVKFSPKQLWYSQTRMNSCSEYKIVLKRVWIWILQEYYAILERYVSFADKPWRKYQDQLKVNYIIPYWLTLIFARKDGCGKRRWWAMFSNVCGFHGCSEQSLRQSWKQMVNRMFVKCRSGIFHRDLWRGFEAASFVVEPCWKMTRPTPK